METVIDELVANRDGTLLLAGIFSLPKDTSTELGPVVLLSRMLKGVEGSPKDFNRSGPSRI